MSGVSVGYGSGVGVSEVLNLGLRSGFYQQGVDETALLAVDNVAKDFGDGFCVLALVLPRWRQFYAASLGAYPTWAEFCCDIKRQHMYDDAVLHRLGVRHTDVGLHICSVDDAVISAWQFMKTMALSVRDGGVAYIPGIGTVTLDVTIGSRGESEDGGAAVHQPQVNEAQNDMVEEARLVIKSWMADGSAYPGALDVFSDVASPALLEDVVLGNSVSKAAAQQFLNVGALKAVIPGAADLLDAEVLGLVSKAPWYPFWRYPQQLVVGGQNRAALRCQHPLEEIGDNHVCALCSRNGAEPKFVVGSPDVDVGSIEEAVGSEDEYRRQRREIRRIESKTAALITLPWAMDVGRRAVTRDCGMYAVPVVENEGVKSLWFDAEGCYLQVSIPPGCVAHAQGTPFLVVGGTNGVLVVVRDALMLRFKSDYRYDRCLVRVMAPVDYMSVMLTHQLYADNGFTDFIDAYADHCDARIFCADDEGVGDPTRGFDQLVVPDRPVCKGVVQQVIRSRARKSCYFAAATCGTRVTVVKGYGYFNNLMVSAGDSIVIAPDIVVHMTYMGEVSMVHGVDSEELYYVRSD